MLVRPCEHITSGRRDGVGEYLLTLAFIVLIISSFRFCNLVISRASRTPPSRAGCPVSPPPRPTPPIGEQFDTPEVPNATRGLTMSATPEKYAQHHSIASFERGHWANKWGGSKLWIILRRASTIASSDSELAQDCMSIGHLIDLSDFSVPSYGSVSECLLET